VPHVKKEMLTFNKILFCATCEEGNAYIFIKYYFVPHVKKEMLTFNKILFCATCEEGNAYI
jgi:hypothetical protein